MPPPRPRADLAIDARGVGKRFGHRRGTVDALVDVDLAVEPGAFVALLGPSGCGKSTLLNIVSGLLRPSRGSVSVHGDPVRGPVEHVGMMFQHPVLLGWRTVRSNVLLSIEVQHGRAAARAAAARADELLELVGLTGFEDRYPRELSGGMQQRAAICRMLVAEPSVLLLDEPFSALDEFTRELMNVELARIVARTGTTALFVTHNIQEAVFLADRVCVMSPRPGRVSGLVDVDLPRPRTPDIITEPAFQDRVRVVRRMLAPSLAQEGDPAGGAEKPAP